MQPICATAVRRFSAAGVHDVEKIKKTLSLWMKGTIFVAVPIFGISTFNVYLVEKHHSQHPHRPEFIEYEYMRIRNRKFPWGDGMHTLFHNPKYNALPGVGYEKDL